MIKVFKKLITTVLICLTTLTVFNIQEASAKDLSKADITCLTRNAYFESRGEGEKGILATVFVVLNRTKDSRFPSTPCKVISQPSQFSWYGKGKVVKDHKTYKQIETLVKEVDSGKHKDLTKGSLYFHHRSIKPHWSKGMKCVVQIGSHKFYK